MSLVQTLRQSNIDHAQKTQVVAPQPQESFLEKSKEIPNTATAPLPPSSDPNPTMLPIDSMKNNSCAMSPTTPSPRIADADAIYEISNTSDPTKEEATILVRTLTNHIEQLAQVFHMEMKIPPNRVFIHSITRKSNSQDAHLHIGFQVENSKERKELKKALLQYVPNVYEKSKNILTILLDEFYGCAIDRQTPLSKTNLLKIYAYLFRVRAIREYRRTGHEEPRRWVLTDVNGEVIHNIYFNSLQEASFFIKRGFFQQKTSFLDMRSYRKPHFLTPSIHYPAHMAPLCDQSGGIIARPIVFVEGVDDTMVAVRSAFSNYSNTPFEILKTFVILPVALYSFADGARLAATRVTTHENLWKKATAEYDSKEKELVDLFRMDVQLRKDLQILCHDIAQCTHNKETVGAKQIIELERCTTELSKVVQQHTQIFQNMQKENAEYRNNGYPRSSPEISDNLLHALVSYNEMREELDKKIETSFSLIMVECPTDMAMSTLLLGLVSMLGTSGTTISLDGLDYIFKNTFASLGAGPTLQDPMILTTQHIHISIHQILENMLLGFTAMGNISIATSQAFFILSGVVSTLATMCHTIPEMKQASKTTREVSDLTTLKPKQRYVLDTVEDIRQRTVDAEFLSGALFKSFLAAGQLCMLLAFYIPLLSPLLVPGIITTAIGVFGSIFSETALGKVLKLEAAASTIDQDIMQSSLSRLLEMFESEQPKEYEQKLALACKELKMAMSNLSTYTFNPEQCSPVLKASLVPSTKETDVADALPSLNQALLMTFNKDETAHESLPQLQMMKEDEPIHSGLLERLLENDDPQAVAQETELEHNTTPHNHRCTPSLQPLPSLQNPPLDPYSPPRVYRNRQTTHVVKILKDTKKMHSDVLDILHGKLAHFSDFSLYTTLYHCYLFKDPLFLKCDSDENRFYYLLEKTLKKQRREFSTPFLYTALKERIIDWCTIYHDQIPPPRFVDIMRKCEQHLLDGAQLISQFMNEKQEVLTILQTDQNVELLLDRASVIPESAEQIPSTTSVIPESAEQIPSTTNVIPELPEQISLTPSVQIDDKKPILQDQDIQENLQPDAPQRVVRPSEESVPQKIVIDKIKKELRVTLKEKPYGLLIRCGLFVKTTLKTLFFPPPRETATTPEESQKISSILKIWYKNPALRSLTEERIIQNMIYVAQRRDNKDGSLFEKAGLISSATPRMRETIKIPILATLLRFVKVIGTKLSVKLRNLDAWQVTGNELSFTRTFHDEKVHCLNSDKLFDMLDNPPPKEEKESYEIYLLLLEILWGTKTSVIDKMFKMKYPKVIRKSILHTVLETLPQAEKKVLLANQLRSFHLELEQESSESCLSYDL